MNGRGLLHKLRLWAARLEVVPLPERIYKHNTAKEGSGTLGPPGRDSGSMAGGPIRRTKMVSISTEPDAILPSVFARGRTFPF